MECSNGLALTLDALELEPSTDGEDCATESVQSINSEDRVVDRAVARARLERDIRKRLVRLVEENCGDGSGRSLGKDVDNAFDFRNQVDKDFVLLNESACSDEQHIPRDDVINHESNVETDNHEVGDRDDAVDAVLGVSSRWRTAFFRLRVARAFSDAGIKGKSRRLDRAWGVALFAVLAAVKFRSALERRQKRQAARRQSARHRWRIAGLKLRAASRFKRANSDDIMSASPGRMIKIAAEEERRRLKRCHVCYIQRTVSFPEEPHSTDKFEAVVPQAVDAAWFQRATSAPTPNKQSGKGALHNDDDLEDYDCELVSSGKKTIELRKGTVRSDGDCELKWPASIASVNSFDSTHTSTSMLSSESASLLPRSASAGDGKHIGSKQSDINEADFEPRRILGTGGSGQVYLVQHVRNHKLFAMKVLSKAQIVATKRMDRVRAERDILTRGHESPFITRLQFAFHNDETLFFVMEYCSGGNLHEVMVREHEVKHQSMSRDLYKFAMMAAAEGHGLYGALALAGFPDSAGTKHMYAGMDTAQVLPQFGLHENQVAFLIAEVILGLEYLHRMGVVYRDLKPQNILLQVDGHIRIADFGVSKKNPGDERKGSPGLVNLRSNSYVGTVEYMSPEVISGENQTSLLDNWGVGMLMYELLTGQPPFLPCGPAAKPDDDSESRRLFRMILHPESSLHFPGDERFGGDEQYCRQQKPWQQERQVSPIKRLGLAARPSSLGRRRSGSAGASGDPARPFHSSNSSSKLLGERGGHVSTDAADLIRAFLRRDAVDRISFTQAKQHPFLAGIAWDRIEKSSGFHKIAPRIHLHRGAAITKGRHSLTRSKDSNIFFGVSHSSRALLESPADAGGEQDTGNTGSNRQRASSLGKEAGTFAQSAPLKPALRRAQSSKIGSSAFKAGKKWVQRVVLRRSSATGDPGRAIAADLAREMGEPCVNDKDFATTGHAPYFKGLTHDTIDRDRSSIPGDTVVAFHSGRTSDMEQNSVAFHSGRTSDMEQNSDQCPNGPLPCFNDFAWKFEFKSHV